MKSYCVFSGQLPESGMQILAYVAQQQEVVVKLSKDVETASFFESLNKLLFDYGFSDMEAKSLIGRIRLIERLSIKGEHLVLDFSVKPSTTESIFNLKFGKTHYAFKFEASENQEPSLVFQSSGSSKFPVKARKELSRLGVKSEIVNIKTVTPKSIVHDLMYKNDAFSKKLGMNIKAVSLGEATVTMKVRKDMTNGFGILHGGVVFSLADSTFAFASNTHGRLAVSVESNISIHQSSEVGDMLKATAKEIHLSHKLAKYEVSVTNQKSQLVATFSGTVYRKSKEWGAM